MDMNSDDSICAVCCLQFSSGKVNSDLRYPIHFEKLNNCASLTGNNNDRSNQLNSDNDGKANRRKLAKTSISLPVICYNCLYSVSSAVDKKTQVNSLEEEVRHLQTQILKLLTKLQSTINTFQSQVKNVEKLIGESSENVKNLDDFFGGKQDNNDDDDMTFSTALKDAIQFRGKILTVLEDLIGFSKELTITSSSATGTNNVVAERAAPVAVSGNLMAVITKEDTNYSNDNDISPASDEDDDRSPERCSKSDDDYELHEDDLRDDDESGGDSDEEFLPSTSKQTEKSETSSKSQLATIDFTGMAPFKKAFLRRVILKSERLSGTREPRKGSSEKVDSFDDIDPLKKHWITYDTATGSITLAGFNLTLNDQDESLQCTKCGFKSHNPKTKTRCAPMERKMYNHILGHHLKLFACPHCPAQIKSHYRFKTHVMGHRNQYTCDICGKPLMGAAVLKRHKWLHLSEDEKAEAVKSGITAPDQQAKQYRKDRPKKFQCSTCGKGFTFQAYLTKHEITHSKERTHMCTQCGKTYKAIEDLRRHLKYVCFPGRGTASHDLSVYRYPCDQCDRKFAFPIRLREHKRDCHSETPQSYKCSMCDKEFRKKSLRATHEKTHSDARPFTCKKGCGATCKTSNNCIRHEKLCKPQ